MVFDASHGGGGGGSPFAHNIFIATREPHTGQWIWLASFCMEVLAEHSLAQMLEKEAVHRALGRPPVLHDLFMGCFDCRNGATFRVTDAKLLGGDRP